MLREGPKKFVYMEFLKHNDGFTLINSLLRIFIISVSMPILVFVFAKIKVIPIEESLQIQQLFYILQNEIYAAEDVYPIGNRLYFKLNTNETATIELYNDMIRRRVEKRGHEIYARDIRTLHLEQLDYGINVKIITIKGDTYERVLIKN